jgi:predicted ArsR family transcriptional regulator
VNVKQMLRGYELLTQAPLGEQNPTVKFVWLYIYQNGEQVYTVKQVCERLGLHVASAQAALKTLERVGLLAQHPQEVGPGAGRGRAGTIRRAIEPQAVGMGDAADPMASDLLPS